MDNSKISVGGYLARVYWKKFYLQPNKWKLLWHSLRATSSFRTAGEAARISFRVPRLTRGFTRIPQMESLLAGYFGEVYSAVHCTLESKDEA